MDMEIEKIKKIVNKIDGWITDKEGSLLYNLAKRCTGRGVVVEIGSWKGKSTIWLGRGLKKENKLYAIDPHANEYNYDYKNIKKFGTGSLEEFKCNIKKAGIETRVIPVVDLSETVAKNFDKPIELIFIDGIHDYDYVKQDFELWFPKVVEGGIMAFHDTIMWEGPKKVVKELVFKSKNFRNVKFIGSITFAEKVRKNSMKDRIRSRYILLLKELYGFKIKLSSLIKKIKKF